MKKNEALAYIVHTADYMARWNVYPSEDADKWINAALKTVDYYYRVLWKAVRDAYSGLLTSYEFETIFIDQISSQFRRGYNDGLREMGLKPDDMLPKWEAELQELMAQELVYVQKLMDDIVAAARIESGYEQFKSRIEMWAHRFDEMRSLAILRAGELTGAMIEWVRGPTEEPCGDCLQYAAMGAQAAIYWIDIERNAGHRPQSRLLECKGYNCQCEYKRVETGIDMLFAPGLKKPKETGMLFAPGLKKPRPAKEKKV